MGIETLTLAQGLQLGGSAYSAIGAYQSSQAQRAAYNAQGQIAENNAQIAQSQAEDALRRGEVAASNQGLKTRQLKGAQRSQLAANGVDLGVGTAQNIVTDTDYFGEIDRATILDSAAREAWGYRVQGSNYQSNASVLRSRADAENPYGAAATSLLTSGGKVASSWYGTKPSTAPAVVDDGYSVGTGSAYRGTRRGM